MTLGIVYISIVHISSATALIMIDICHRFHKFTKLLCKFPFFHLCLKLFSYKMKYSRNNLFLMSRYVEISHDLWSNVIDFYLASQVFFSSPSKALLPMWLMCPMDLLFTLTIAKTKKKLTKSWIKIFTSQIIFFQLASSKNTL